jgi:hypothetical protein
MRAAGLILGWLLAMGLVGCGDAAGDAAKLTCAPKELRVAGMADGNDVNLVRPVTTYAFANKLGAAGPGTVDASTAQGSLSLEFDMLTIDGGTSTARGSVVDADSSLSIGNCATGNFVSTLTVDADGNGVHFTLRNLNHEPYCGGAAVTGALSGCLGFSNP